MPRRLELDFCAPRTRLRYAGWVLLGAGVVALALTYVHYRHVENASQMTEANIRALMLGAPGRQPSAAQGSEVEALRKQLAAANEVVRRLSLPWARLFVDIEGAASEGIALLAIEPDLAKKQVRISGEAKNAPVLAGYIDNLEATASLDHVHISQHEMREDQGAASLRFALLATWSGEQ